MLQPLPLLGILPIKSQTKPLLPAEADSLAIAMTRLPN